MTALGKQFEDTLKELGTYLRGLREAANRDQESLAKDAGVSHTYISKLERAATSLPGMELAMRLCEILDGDEEYVRQLMLKAKIAKLFKEDRDRQEVSGEQIANAAIDLAIATGQDPKELMRLLRDRADAGS